MQVLRSLHTAICVRIQGMHVHIYMSSGMYVLIYMYILIISTCPHATAVGEASSVYMMYIYMYVYAIYMS